MRQSKLMLLASTLAVTAGFGPAALAHEVHDDGDSIRVTINVDGRDHDVVVDEDGVKVDGRRIEDIEVEIKVNGNIDDVIDQILDEVEEALDEADKAVEEARRETRGD